MEAPGDDARHFITGQTGSGKTVFGLFCLSGRSYDKMPWIIIDFKRDIEIGTIPRLTEIGLNDRLPKQAGLYVVRPHPDDTDSGAITSWFYRVWEKERAGLYIDESYMINPRDKGLKAVLTQGRSKRIPVIALAQRPRDVSTFLMSESEYKTIFRLDHPDDLERIRQYVPAVDQNGNKIKPLELPKRESYWYCSTDWTLTRMSACPAPDEIMNVFDKRVKRNPLSIFDVFTPTQNPRVA